MSPPSSSPGPRERELFLGALDQPTVAERKAYLDRACAGDEPLRQRLETLLARHAQPDDFLDWLGPGLPKSTAGSHRGDGLPSGAVEGAPSEPTGPAPASPGNRAACGDEQPGDRIGPYRLLERLGEGGCGVVYVAEQQEPVRRRVALKVIKLGMDTRSVVARFEAERQALALMDHPNIARFLDAGVTGAAHSELRTPKSEIPPGRPYFVMELVRGVRITDYCEQNRLPVRERIDLFIPVCRAVQHAHQKGIVHRDLKPSNVLVTVNDGVAVPKVIDFGIAKAIAGELLTDKTLYTAFEQFIGTPAYMSPEQALMTSVDIDTRSDIYSLGVLLYELLTGHTPFDTKELLASGLDGLRKTILEKEPLRPSTRLARDRPTRNRKSEVRSRKSGIARDLDWIVMKCLEKNRARRYETANGLAMDLRRYLEEEPVVARPPSTAYRLQRFVRRNRLAVAAGLAVAAALALGTVTSLLGLQQARRALRAAEASERRAKAAQAGEAAMRRQAEAHAYASDMRLAQQELARNNLGGSLALLDRYRPDPEGPELRGWEWRYLWHQTRTDPFAVCGRVRHEIHSLAVSADEQWLAVGELEAGGVSLFHLPTASQVGRLPAGNGGVQVAFAPAGSLLAYSGWSDPGPDTVVVHDAGTNSRLTEWPLSGRCQGLAFSTDGGRLAVFLSEPHQLGIWDWKTRREEVTLPAPQAANFHNAFAVHWPSGTVALSGGRLGELRVVDLSTGRDRWTTKVEDDRVTALAFSPDGRLLVAGTGFRLGQLVVWDVATGVALGRLQGHSSWITALAFWPDGTRLASASADQTVRTWNPREPVQAAPSAIFRGHRSEVSTLAVLPRFGQVLSGASDGSIHRWTGDPQRDRRSAVVVPAEIVAWTFAGESGFVLTLDQRGQVAEWRPPDYRLERPRLEVGGPFLSGAFSDEGRWLATGSTNRLLQLFDLSRGRLAGQFVGPDDEALPAAFDSRSERFYSCHRGDGTVVEWDRATQARRRSWHLATPGPARLQCAVSADDRWLAFADYGGACKIVDLVTGTTRDGDLGITQISRLALSRNGAMLAAASWKGEARVWLTAHLDAPIALGPFMHGVCSVAFSPDNRRLAVTSDGPDAALLWDLETFRHVLTLEGEGAGFRFGAFAPDGRAFGARTANGQLHLWPAPSWDEIEAAEPGRSP